LKGEIFVSNRQQNYRNFIKTLNLPIPRHFMYFL